MPGPRERGEHDRRGVASQCGGFRAAVAAARGRDGGAGGRRVDGHDRRRGCQPHRRGHGCRRRDPDAPRRRPAALGRRPRRPARRAGRVRGVRRERRQPRERGGAHGSAGRAVGRGRHRVALPRAGQAHAAGPLTDVPAAHRRGPVARRGRPDLRPQLDAGPGRARLPDDVCRRLRAGGAARPRHRRARGTAAAAAVPRRRVHRAGEQPGLPRDAVERREPARADPGRMVRRGDDRRDRPRDRGRGACRPGAGGVGVEAAGALPA